MRIDVIKSSLHPSIPPCTQSFPAFQTAKNVFHKTIPDEFYTTGILKGSNCQSLSVNTSLKCTNHWLYFLRAQELNT